ncbi:hypothetical protein AWM79_21140 [Pseudomonas agarici]|uniref:Uncharacterized protein n=2 Tax=Pseudomonas agarici TaxID=46677 RepID=A0A0X1T6E0_PSEAA|nr:hypothetical protein AWM79_21140 [Pseudomonas agarici]
MGTGVKTSGLDSIQGLTMSFYYQVTNVKNLFSIKLYGLAPRVNRPAGLAQGATAQDRTASEAGKVESFVREFLFKILKDGHSIESILQAANPGIILEPPLITGEIDYSTTPPTRIDNLWLDANSQEYIERYCKLLGKGTVNKSSFKALKLDTYTNYKKAYASLARAFIAINPDHFLTQLAIRHVRTYYEIEFMVAGTNIYFFDQQNMIINYGGYVKTIGGGLYEKMALLRVHQSNLGKLYPDSAQGNAVTSKNSVPATAIEFIIGASLESVNTGTIFNNGEWHALSTISFTKLSEHLPAITKS